MTLNATKKEGLSFVVMLNLHHYFKILSGALKTEQKILAVYVFLLGIKFIVHVHSEYMLPKICPLYLLLYQINE